MSCDVLCRVVFCSWEGEGGSGEQVRQSSDSLVVSDIVASIRDSEVQDCGVGLMMKVVQLVLGVVKFVETIVVEVASDPCQ